MKTEDVVRTFYDSLSKRDDRWQSLLSDDVTFQDASYKLAATGKAAFVASFTSFLRAVQSLQIKQLIIQVDDACAVVSYDYISPTGATMHQDDAEVWHIEKGLVGSLTIYFDITEFRKFMSGQQ